MKLSMIMSLLIATAYAFPAPDPEEVLVRNVRSPDLGNLAKWNPATASEYLGKFGYMSHKRAASAKLGGLVDKKSFAKSIREFQRMAGLPASGELNRETMRMMSMDRCGVEDRIGSVMMGSNGNEADSKFMSKATRRRRNRSRKSKKRRRSGARSRSKRYNVEGDRWSNTKLKYYIENRTPDMTAAQVDDSIQRAFDVWANYTTLRFRQTRNPSEANFKISFGAGSHGDPYAFDGKGGTLAHAFFPSDGRAHFDEAEHYTYKGGPGVNLFIVAAHEFGHALGLGHSSVPNSLMAPFYQGYTANFQLHDDDIAGIQQLYGKKVDVDAKKKRPTKPPTARPTAPTTTARPRPADAMNVCGKNISFDCMFFDQQKQSVFALKGKYFWKINDYGVVDGYPKKIYQYWKGLPGNIQAAAYSRITRRTYFFKGRRMWRFNGRVLDPGFPRDSSDLALPANPSAALQWGGDGNIYVFRKSYFYRFSEWQPFDGRKRYQHKKIAKFWTGIPNAPDAAIQWKNGKSYFFKRNDYWRFNGIDRDVDPNYPKSIKKLWIGCQGKTSAKLTKKNRKSKKGRKGRKNSRRTNTPPLARLELAPGSSNPQH
uniref:matrix metalloproteinase-14 isoform X4 n=1 Tax=Ciona intestinalis TaxID=7719 RepID=UPI00089DC31B|nr:matrix metalloproteinase-14 isoform X4 [Ciona intestinalis]|eukprot:XP_018668837.1 matrix metalloproteinase-14 isoform X4 [Ciona intestinalis]